MRRSALESVEACVQRRCRDRWPHLCAALGINGAARPMRFDTETDASGTWWHLRVIVSLPVGERWHVVDLGSVPLVRLDELLDSGEAWLAAERAQRFNDAVSLLTLGLVTVAAVLFILALLEVGEAEPVELHPPDDAGVLLELQQPVAMGGRP